MKLEGYKTGGGNICITSCLRDILNFFGYEVRENMVFAVSLANMFYYEEFTPGEDEKLRMGGIYYDVLTVIENAVKFFGLELVHNTSDDDDEIAGFVRDNLNNGYPVMAITSRKYLDYMPEQFKDDVPHCINIIGLEGDDFIASDTYIPKKRVETYEGFLSKDSFLNSMKYARDIYQERFRYQCLAIKPIPKEDREVKTFQDFLYEKLCMPVLAAARTYIGGEVPEEKVLIGAKGLRKFRKDLLSWFTTQDIDKIKHVLKTIHNHMVDFGGCVTTYQFFSDYFTILGQKSGEAVWFRLSDDMQFLSRRWFILANTICKSAFIVQEDTKENIDTRLNELVQIEMVLWKKVQSVCEKL